MGGWGWVKWWVGRWIDRQRVDFAHPRRGILGTDHRIVKEKSMSNHTHKMR